MKATKGAKDNRVCAKAAPPSHMPRHEFVATSLGVTYQVYIVGQAIEETLYSTCAFYNFLEVLWIRVRM
jgi:hypothetical protein